MNTDNLNVFEKIIEPVVPFITEAQNRIPNDAATYTLSLLPFTINIIFAIINRIPSISLLVTEIKTSDTAKTLGLATASKSMYSEAFVRYDPAIFRSVFNSVRHNFCMGHFEHLRLYSNPKLQKANNK